MAKKSGGSGITLNGYGMRSAEDIVRGLMDNMTVYWKPVYQAGRMPQGNFALRATPAGWSAVGITPGRIWNNLDRQLSGRDNDRFLLSGKDMKDIVSSLPARRKGEFTTPDRGEGRTGVRDIDRLDSFLASRGERPGTFSYSIGPYRQEEEETLYSGYGDGGSVGATRDVSHLARLFGLRPERIR